jgi:rhodanese-related sulfurtransferase
VVREVSPTEYIREAATRPAMLLLDVREAWEREIAMLPQALHVPMAELAGRLAEIGRDKDVVVMCRSGGRSLTVAKYLEEQGYRSVANLTGGILAWARDVDPTLATY